MENQTITLPAEVIKIAEQVSVEKRSEVQNVLNQVFIGVSKMREQLDSIVVQDENDKVNMKMANAIRLGVRDVRLDAEKVFDAKRDFVQQQMIGHKTEDALWLKAKQTMQILTKEIEEQARYKEETKKRFEAEQFELKMEQRLLKVKQFNIEVTIHDVRQFNDDNFDVYLQGLEKIHNEKIELAKKEEEERQAKLKQEAEERERVRLENEKLKIEAIEKEKQLAEERAKAEKERKEAELKAAEERKLIEEEARKQREMVEAKAAEEKAKRVKAELELEEQKEALRRKKEAEERLQKQVELEAKKAAKAPIKQQLNKWVDSFSLGKPLSENDTTVEIEVKFEAFRVWAKSQIEKI